MIKIYGSISELRHDWLRFGLDSGHDNDLSWFGDETKSETIRFSAEGNTALVPEAEVMLSKLDTLIETPRRQWERSPAGAFCSVPDLLAGLPTPMRRQVFVPDDRAPITIIASTMSSAGLSAPTLRRRGVTILALVMALSRVRPVSLFQLTAGDGYKDGTGESVLLAPINTTPLDLATACYVLTSSGWSRRLTYQTIKGLNNFRGGWPDKLNYFNPQKYYDDLTLRLGYDPKTTLMIQGPQLNDELVSQPLAWIKRQIAHFTQQEELA